MVMSIDYKLVLLNELLTRELLVKYAEYMGGYGEEVDPLQDLQKKLKWLLDAPIFKDIGVTLINEIREMCESSLKNFKEINFYNRIRIIETSQFLGIVELLWRKLKSSDKTLEEELKKGKESYVKEIQKIAKKRVKSLYESLEGHLESKLNKMKGYLSIYKCGEAIRDLIKYEIIRLKNEIVGGRAVQSYFCEIAGGEPLTLSSELIQLVKPIDKFKIKDNLLEKFTEKWRKNPEEACSLLTKHFCSLNELKGRGKVVLDQLRHLLPKILSNEQEDENIKSILQAMLFQREILEFGVFECLVNGGFPSIPKVEVWRAESRVGECDVFVQIEEDRFLGLEITIRRDLNDKVGKLKEIQEVLKSKGLNYDFCLITDEIKKAEGVEELEGRVLELKEFSGKKLIDNLCNI